MPELSLPKYQSITVVQAVKIKDFVLDSFDALRTGRESNGGATIFPEDNGIAPFFVEDRFVKTQRPKIGGYFAVFDSIPGAQFITAADFESKFTKI